jgi:flagellar motor protein MotB
LSKCRYFVTVHVSLSKHLHTGLTREKAIIHHKIAMRGDGEEQPIVANNTDETRKLNRRMKVLVWD